MPPIRWRTEMTWCKGVRLICTKLVQTNLTPLHQNGGCSRVPYTLTEYVNGSVYYRA